jgi:hypothetical protein
MADEIIFKCRPIFADVLLLLTADVRLTMKPMTPLHSVLQFCILNVVQVQGQLVMVMGHRSPVILRNSTSQKMEFVVCNYYVNEPRFYQYQVLIADIIYLSIYL